MVVSERREREIEEMKELILSTAAAIASSEGYDKVSVRKIANKIEYSPSIIYHYFADKDEIINIIMQRGYQNIILAIASANIKRDSPEEQLIEMTRNYINAALEMPEEYMAAQLSKSPRTIKQTSFLFEGASNEKPIIAALCRCIKEINKDVDLEDSKCELISQLIIASAMGLVIKLIVEKETGDEQRNRLIECFENEIVLKIAKVVINK